MSLRLPVLVSGDSRTLTLPATNPQTGLPLTIPGGATLLFSAKFSKYDLDIDSVFQKVTGAGITSAGSTITVAIVAEDTAPLLEYADLYCDVQAQDISFGILTVWEGILPVRLGVTQEIATSIPVFTTNPPVPGSGTGDMLASVYDTNADGKVNSAAAADAAPWAGITGKPATFPPESHTHPLSDLSQSGATNGQVPTWTGSAFVPQTPEAGGGGGGGDMFKATYDPDLDGKVVSADSADSVAWVGVTGKPTTFAPSAHTHAQSEITGLVSDLAGKSDTGHTHTAAAVGADPTGTAAAAVTAHEAAADPHPGYVTPAELAPAIAGKADTATLTAHTTDTANPHAVTKTQVGLSNVDNTADASKPVSTAQATAIGLKADTTALTAHTGDTANPHAVSKAQVGLGSADNTSDLGKPISTLAQTALDAKQPLDADLTAIAALTTSSFGRSLLTQADAAATRATIGAGTSSFDGVFASLTSIPTTLAGYGISDAQPLDADLTSIAALGTTAFGRGLLTEANAASARTTLGAGTSSFDGVFASLTSKPTTRSGYGITDAAANGLATGSGLTMATARILGRTTAATGAIEELTIGTSLSLTAGALDAIQDLRTTATPTFVGINGTTLLLKTGGTTALTIDASQNVGIGVTPSNKLHISVVGVPQIRLSDEVVGGGYGGAIRGYSVGGQGGKLGLGTYEANTWSERIHINESGLVGIGGVPARLLHLQAASAPFLQLTNSTTGHTSGDGFQLQQSGVDTYIENAEAGSMFLRTSGTTRLTIDSAGNITLAAASNQQVRIGRSINSANCRLEVVHDSSVADIQQNGAMIADINGVAGSQPAIYFLRGASYTSVGSIATTLTATTYNTSSDARLKKNFRDLGDEMDVGALIDSIKPRRFTWKMTNEDANGFIAQELYQVCPDAVTVGEGEKSWGVDFAKLVPYLVAETKSLRARVRTLEAAVNN